MPDSAEAGGRSRLAAAFRQMTHFFAMMLTVSGQRALAGEHLLEELLGVRAVCDAQLVRVLARRDGDRGDIRASQSPRAGPDGG